ncbi:MAG: YraN family protein [Neisseria sp.]|nr:YraN family protein [Neisseria sp.]
MRLNHPQGIAAENRALAFLEAQGCRLHERNWHCPFGEIDLIVQQGKTLIFVEVKYRKNNNFGGAAYSISPSKLAKMSRSAEHYLQSKKLNLDCRLDAVLIEGDGEPVWLHNITG